MAGNALPTYEVHVVCVDDNREFLHSLGLILPDQMNALRDDNGWLRFSFFEHPREALDFLKEIQSMGEDVALIVSDQKMPEMKGTDFLAQARAITPAASCALLTGYAGIDSAVEAINGKFLDRYLTKPISDEHNFVLTLHELIQNYLMKRTIDRQGSALEGLYSFANTLNSIDGFQAALDYIVSFTSESLHCKRVSLMLLEDQTDQDAQLTIAAAKGLPEHIIASTRLRLGDRIAGSVMQQRKAVYAKDMGDVGISRSDQTLSEAEFMSVPMLWASLQSSQTPVGVINATEKQEGQVFDQADLEILTYISNTATIAITNHLNAQRLKEAYIETKTQAAALAHSMVRNSLTGLPNRVELSNTLRHMLRSHAPQPCLTLVMVNLNRFRDINCAIGHQGGDLVLRAIARRLESVIVEHALYHIGSDEFAILMEDSDEAAQATLIETIQQRMTQPITCEGTSISVQMTFGIAQYPDHARDEKLLMQKADVALNQAKQQGKHVHVYNAEKDLYNTRRMAMTEELRQAIEADELVLHYQPKIRLKTGEVEGVEALVRWLHPVHGFTPPDQFIPLAEQTGLIEGLTEWVLCKAVQQNKDWQTRYIGKGNMTVAVNLSTLNLLESGFAEKVKRICDEARLATSTMHFEITESVIMSNLDLTLSTLNTLHHMGFGIDLDDFGTGYSSLAYVKHLPIDAIKIDRSFIREITEDEQDVQIVQSIIELGHSLKLKLIAEGVEDQHAIDLLRAIGCDSVQGYFYSRPLAAKEFESWLEHFN